MSCDLWEEFVKSVEKIKHDKMTRLNSILEKKIFINIEKPEIVIPKRLVDVIPMPKKDQRNFIGKARLDLHGCTVDKLCNRLTKFCISCIQENIQNIVIITGKGSYILHGKTKEWLEYASDYVVSFAAVKDIRGQSGQFIVKLRRLR